ncbi:MAG: response regulator, partial [Candidatus Krumholzibacteria bacterium]|nr:response regulator [Candidatus Krumholzibacteria bacterium]
QMRVADNGPGLPDGGPEDVFVRGVSRSGEKGRGLGLPGCRPGLAGVGGHLTAEPNTGNGAVFALDLPVGRERARTEGPGEASAPAIRVLVVDDEAVVREMLQDVLVELGCEVQACRDGRATLADYVSGSAEVALIDQNLPGLSGLELATRLRVGDPCLSIVMVTGWEQDDSLAGADPAVVDQKAGKPLELARIREILRDGQQLNQERRAAASAE